MCGKGTFSQIRSHLMIHDQYCIILVFKINSAVIKILLHCGRSLHQLTYAQHLHKPMHFTSLVFRIQLMQLPTAYLLTVSNQAQLAVCYHYDYITENRGANIY